MKAIIEIDDRKGCITCPYCSFEDDMPGTPENYFYCRKSKKILSEFYNNSDDNGIVIPNWCQLKEV